MNYESKIGWRYLYGGKHDRRMQLLAGVGVAGILAGTAMLQFSSGPSPYGVLIIVLSMIFTAVCFLFSVFSVFTTVSVLGVVLGVAALTVVLAVTTGFQKQFRDKVLGVNAHVIVLKSGTTFAEYRDVMKTASEIDREVLAVQPFIFAEMLATRGQGALSGVAIKGIDPKLVRDVLDLDKHMIEGSVDTLLLRACPRGESQGKAQGKPAGKSDQPALNAIDKPPCLEYPPIIMGKELARKLKAKRGDSLTVVAPFSNVDHETWRATSSTPRSRKFTVTGIFYSGFDEYDKRLMYTSLADTQELVGQSEKVMGVELKVKDVDRAEQIARRLERVLGGPPYQVQDWYELNHNLFMALMLQKLALVVILTLIILVATVNMVSALVMKVTEKTREIAILKAMGATSSSTAFVFWVFGIAIGAIGTTIGVTIGLATCYVVSKHGYHLDPKVYLIDRLPIEVRPIEVVLIVSITMVISMVATLIPSIAAASLRPVEGLRYD